MALQIKYTTPSGVVLPEAYVHIANFIGNKDIIECRLVIYKDVNAKIENLESIGTLNARLIIANGATMANMYAILKLQSPFIGATNC